MSLDCGMRRQAGFSLVELMVGMVLGLMLIAGAVSIYLATSQSYREVEQVAAVTENARFAEQLIGDSLRHAGFFGETTANRVDVDPSLSAGVVGGCSGNASAYDLAQFIAAATADGSGDALGCIDDARATTDVLVIKHALPRPFTDGPRVADPNNPGDGVIDNPSGLDAQKVYVMTNNVGGLLFAGGSPPNILTGGEIPGGTAWEYQYEVYYIRDPDPGSTRDAPKLSRKILEWNGAAMALSAPEDIAEGVENLKLMFGFDSDNDGEVDTYKGMATIAAGEWRNVESVEVYMLVRSATPDAQYTDAKAYQLGATAVAAPMDNYRRLISFTSVSLRNLKLMIRGGA